MVAFNDALPYASGTVGAALKASQGGAAVTLYVAPAGNDANDGSSGAPFATLQKAFDEQYNPQHNDPFGGGAERDQAYWKARQAAEAQLQAQIKAVVGEARYADSIRQQDNDWRQLEAATRRLALPADTPARLYPLRDSTADRMTGPTVTVFAIASNPVP